MSRPTIFEYKMPLTDENREMIDEFERFWFDNELDELFTDEHRVPYNIIVHWSHVRNVVSPSSGKYRADLLRFKDIMKKDTESDQYQRVMRQILVQSKGQFKVQMEKIQAVSRVIENAPPEYNTRLWQAAYYSEEGLNMPTQIRHGRRIG